MLKSQELFSTKKIQNSTEPKFDFDDILIEPAITTEIGSRSIISITYHHEYRHSNYEHLPLITAPMDTVVSKENRDFFISNNINICYPRGIETDRYNINGKMCFVSYSLNDFIIKFIDNDYHFKNDEEINVCIDTANGHIDTLKKSISIAKDRYGDKLIIMAGNVANPYSYVELSKAGCSFVRLGIGNGNGCFLGGTEVLTQDGHKKIEDIEVGEMVLTHKGNFKEVIAKVNYLSQEEEIYDINNIKCTENHEFLVIDKKNKNLINEKNYLDYSFWIPASEIDENIHMILELDMKIKLHEIKKTKLEDHKNNYVFDLTIKDDHSYVVSEKNIIVHNCLTTQQTAIGYPMGSLVQECYDLKLKHQCEAKIVADGGMKKYSDIIKALALGADYVMVGNLFNKSLESCGDTFLFNRFKVDPNSKFAKWLYQNKFKLTKKFRGMSTKEVQKDWGKKIIKTSEGISTIRPVEYTLGQWTENFEHYLKSSMSYTNHLDLVSFIGNVDYNLITMNAHLRYKK